MILYQRVIALSSAVLSNEDLAERIKQGERQYIPELWEQTRKLLYSFAFKYYTRYSERFAACGITLEDLQQECFIILLNMVEAYDPNKDYKLNTYMKYQFKCHLRTLLRVGGNYAEEPLNACNSLSDRIIGLSDEEITIADTLEDEAAELAYTDVDELIYQHQMRLALNEAMSTALTPEQIRIIVERYYNYRTLAEVGELMNITSGAARERERNALRDLRRYNNVTKKLESFRTEIITEHAYKYTGLSSFKYNLSSSVERTFEKMERLERLYKTH